MSRFSAIEFNPIPHGKQAIVYFPNGYGASILSSEFSYGGKKGLFEIAVLNSKGEIIYNTPITNDVIGYLTAEGVDDILDRICNLPSRYN